MPDWRHKLRRWSIERSLHRINSLLKSVKHADGLLLLVRFTLGLLLAQMLIAGLHEILILAVASLLRSLDIHGLTGLAEQSPVEVDGVHVQLVLNTLTGIRPRGIALAEPLGGWLHNFLPSFFLDPSHTVPGTWISAVLSRGSSVLSVFITRAVSEMVLIALGTWIVRAGLGHLARVFLVRHRRITLTWSSALGLFLQAQGVWGLVRLTPTGVELEYMGAGLLARMLLHENDNLYEPFMNQILAPFVPTLLVVMALGSVPLFERLVRAGARAWSVLIRRKVSFVTQPKTSLPHLPPRHDLVIGFTLMLALTVLWPRSSSARSNFRYSQTKGPTPIRVAFQARATNTPLPSNTTKAAAASPTPKGASTLASTRVPSTGALTVQTPTRSAPSPTAPPTVPSVDIRTFAQERVVQVHWSPARSHFVLTNQNGELFSIRGVNYNTHYTRLPQEEHVKILRRDFDLMRRAGVNVISGYASFDETTLRVAQEYGLSVIMPYVLDLTKDYLDPEVRNQARQDFAAFIKRFENYPSLLMWNFDDEPLHNMGERLGRPKEQVQALSDLHMELAELAFLTDRYHRPSWLKEPREWYLDFLDESLKTTRRRIAQEASQGHALPEPSQYIVSARSAYGVPVDIEEWQPRLSFKLEKELNLPYAIGEYGIVGSDPKDRADSLVRLWQENVRNSAIGSAVYTFGPFQPDPNDLTPPSIAEQLKLVDEDGTPVDESWKKLAEVWLAQQAEEKENRFRSSIPLAVPEFRDAVEQWGGYPASGPIRDGAVVKQFFVEGKQDNHFIAYALAWDKLTGQTEFQRVESITFNELGDYVLSADLLQAYMDHGGYARFGAPLGNLTKLESDGAPVYVQKFAKGSELVRERVPD